MVNSSAFNQSFDKLTEEATNIYDISDQDSDQDLYINPISTEEEYNICFKKANESFKSDLFLYWKNNSFKFPILSILARRYLAIPATSASIESTFNIAGNIITKARNSL